MAPATLAPDPITPPDQMRPRVLPLDTDRNAFLGASEVGAILGFSKYATPLLVHLRKRGEAPETPPSPVMEWGNRLEHAVRIAYVEKVLRGDDGLLTAGEDLGRVQHPTIGWMVCSPDGIVHRADVPASDPSGWRFGLECKTADRAVAHLWGESGTDQVPDGYALQCHYSMYVTGLDRWDVAVLIGGNDFRHYTLRRDDDLLESVLPALIAFWDGVLLGVTPEPMAPDNALLGKLLKQSREELIEGDDEIATLAQALVSAKADLAVAEEQVDEIEARIKARIGDRAGALGPWGKVTWKTNRDSEVVDWKSVARDAGATDFQIAAHAATKPGARVFRFTPTGAGK